MNCERWANSVVIIVLEIMEALRIIDSIKWKNCCTSWKCDRLQDGGTVHLILWFQLYLPLFGIFEYNIFNNIYLKFKIQTSSIKCLNTNSKCFFLNHLCVENNFTRFHNSTTLIQQDSIKAKFACNKSKLHFHLFEIFIVMHQFALWQ